MKWLRIIVAATLLVGVAAILSSQAQVPSMTEPSCYGVDRPVGAVVLIDPVTNNCFIEKGTPGAPNVINDNFESTKATYSASVTGLVPVALGATDVITLSASATKKTRLLQVSVTCTATAVSVPITVVKRSTLDSGGTSAAMTAVPHESTDPVATAAAASYTANPTALGTTVGAIRAQTTNFNAAAAANAAGNVAFIFGSYNDKTGILQKNSTEQIAVNFNTTAITSGLCTAWLEWTEE